VFVGLLLLPVLTSIYLVIRLRSSQPNVAGQRLAV
jgi:hypothetical protein